ncbi:hypothetical protein like AT5G53020 [Hibiscus trionum]|uniref:Uncharacterized protein n=1 Tax=Hibiscus trionum TaxID=183268 RepID=A0A9W7JFJ1_HIBTR|nr:hypothetical protein like AT5G53020 [Hibiscus trionum]
MDEKRISGSYLIISEDESDSLYPMYFGVSCAFFALRFLLGPEEGDRKWSEFRDTMLQGSAHLLGLLLWRIQREEAANVGKAELLRKLETAEREIEELKQMRHEDAKANEKVVCIFASQEQGWLIERKKLRLQIGVLVNELRALEKKKDEEIADLNNRLNEMEISVDSKDKMIEEMELKVKELEEKAIKFESVAQELRETLKRDAQEHSTELWKHKTAFIELVSNQRQVEAEMGRALRQVEATKMELDAVLEQKEESVMLAQNLSMEITKMRKDSEQKDKILSAMLRKSKLDTAEKQLLLKEVKVSKAKKKQAELETERWKAVSETRHERHSLKGMFSNQAQASAKLDVSELKTDPDCQSPEGNEDFVVTADVKRLESWVRAEAEKYANVIEKRHHLELDAFAEQMRLKDEKLESIRWRLLSMELESERLQSNIEGLNLDVSQLRQDNMKLEALLLEREEELDSLKDQFASQLKPLSCQKGDIFNLSLHDPALTHDSFWPKVKIIKKKPTEKEQETKTTLLDKEGVIPSCNESNSKNIRLIVQSPEKEFEEEREPIDPGSIQKDTNGSSAVESSDKLVSIAQSMGAKTKNNPWRMDLQALGVSYKIKRLKQQLLMLERLKGKQESGEGTDGGGDNGMKAFLLLISLLHKQVSRYQSLQGKIDDLCKRMHDNNVESSQGDCSTAKTKGETRTLEHFLEETFHLQRYMVATGQKLMEIQTKITSELNGVELDKTTTFDMKRFSDNIKSLFQEVQRGLEVRIARIIGDLEGTLACEGMIHFRRL